MEHIELRDTLGRLFQGYQSERGLPLALEQAVRLYEQKYGRQPDEWTEAPPGMLLLGPVPEKWQTPAKPGQRGAG